MLLLNIIQNIMANAPLNCCCKLLKDKAIYGGKIFLKNRIIFYHVKSMHH